MKSLDGEHQNAYVLGVDKPLKNFKGNVIGTINRKDDNEDKLIVSGGRESYTKDEIKRAVAFQEKHFKSRIILAPSSK